MRLNTEITEFPSYFIWNNPYGGRSGILDAGPNNQICQLHGQNYLLSNRHEVAKVYDANFKRRTRLQISNSFPACKSQPFF